MAAVDARKNRDTAQQALQKASEYGKKCYRLLKNSKKSYDKSVENEDTLREKVKGYDQMISVMQQIDTSLHASKNEGTQKFTVQLTTPIRSVKLETFSDDDVEELSNHVVTGVGEKQAGGGAGMAGMKTTGEESSDYQDPDGGKPTGKEGDGAKTTDEEAAKPSDSKEPDGGKPTSKEGRGANVSKK